jgi:hypothetical protein
MNSKITQHKSLATTYSMDKEFKVQLAVIRGNINLDMDNNAIVNDDFYTSIMTDISHHKGIRLAMKRNDDKRLVFSFDTEQESDHFLNYLKTDFARFCLVIYKTSANQRVGSLNLIPWLDFTQEWNDEKLFAFFEIDQETQDYIRAFLPDYHSIR